MFTTDSQHRDETTVHATAAPMPQDEAAAAPTTTALMPRDETASALTASMVVPAYSLRIDSHQVHRIDGEDLIISTLKDITLSVVLVDNQEQVVTDGDVPLTAHLLFENGHPVEQVDRHQPVMKGGQATMVDGVATFKLRINVLSSLRQNQKFRVLIAGRHAGGKLEVITNAMRSITKLWRGVREPAEQETERAAGQASAASVGGLAECAEGGPVKRKAAELSYLLSMINDHDRSIGDLRESQQAIMGELKILSDAARRRQELPHALAGD